MPPTMAVETAGPAALDRTMQDAADVHEPAATRHRPSRLTVFGAAFVAGAVAAFGINSVLDSHLIRSQPQVECEPIFVALRSLPQGTPVTVWDVALRDWPRAMLPQTALRAEDTFEGRILRHPLREGQPLLSVQLAEAETAGARSSDGPLTTSALAAAVEEAFAPPVPATESFAAPTPATTDTTPIRTPTPPQAPGTVPPTATTRPTEGEVFVAVEPLESAASTADPLDEPTPADEPAVAIDTTPSTLVEATLPPTTAAVPDPVAELLDPPTIAIEAPDVAGEAARTEALETPDAIALANPVVEELQPVTDDGIAADESPAPEFPQFQFSPSQFFPPSSEETDVARTEIGGDEADATVTDAVARQDRVPGETADVPSPIDPAGIAPDAFIPAAPAATPNELASPPAMAVTPLPSVTETAPAQRLVPLAPAPSTDIEGPLATLSRQRAAQTAASQPGSVIAAADPLDAPPTPASAPRATPIDPPTAATPALPSADAAATVDTAPPTAPSGVANDVLNWSTAEGPAAPAPAAIPAVDPAPSAGTEAAGPPPLRHLVVPERIAMQADTSFVMPQRPTATAMPDAAAQETASTTTATSQGVPSSTSATQAAGPRTPQSPAQPRPMPMANQHFPHPQRASSGHGGKPQASRHPQSQRRPESQQRPSQPQAQSQRSWSDGPVLRAIGGFFQGFDGSTQGGGSRTR